MAAFPVRTMFSFFRKKKPQPAPVEAPPAPPAPIEPSDAATRAEPPGAAAAPDAQTDDAVASPAEPETEAQEAPVSSEPAGVAPTLGVTPATESGQTPEAASEPQRSGWRERLRQGWRRSDSTSAPPAQAESAGAAEHPTVEPLVHAPAADGQTDPVGAELAEARAEAEAVAAVTVADDTAQPTEIPPLEQPEPALEAEPEIQRQGWRERLRQGLRKTGSSITQVFTGTKIDDALYEELEDALLMADAGVDAAAYLLRDVKWRVKDARAGNPAAVKELLADAIAELLQPLEASLVVGEHMPTVIMVVGVNGAGKTTSVGKLTRHLADAQQKVLLAAADTFRAAAREQLAVWAERAGAQPSLLGRQVEIVSQDSGDPAAVSFDSVVAGKARGCDVVIVDTAGRLTTQAHLMEELKKIRRVITKAQADAPHEVLLVVDGNTGQNALAQVKAFDAALELTGLIVTKLDGTAKGGVLAALALWSRESKRSVPVYFVGVGEKLEDLQTFNAREFAQALLG